MTESNASIAIVVDPNFGERLLSLASQMPVWIVDTPSNRTCAKAFWSHASSVRSRVTTFRVTGDDSEEWCQTIFPQVDLHHGEYSQSPIYDSVDVFVVDPTADLRDAFSKYGFTILSERPNGFRAVR